MSEPLILAPNELVIPLNALAEKKRTLTLTYSPLEFELLKYDPHEGPDGTIKQIAPLELKRRREAGGFTDEVFHEILSADDVRAAAISSGLLLPPNLPEVRERLAEERKRATRATRPVPTYLALDTNLFYERFFRLGEPPASLHGERNGFLLAVSEGVRNELNHAASKEFTAELAAKFEEQTGLPGFARAMVGRKIKKARKARLGLADLVHLTKGSFTAQPASAETGYDNDENDRIIAQSYRALAAQGDVLLLTSDSGMGTRARGERVEALVIQHPRLEDWKPAAVQDMRAFARFLSDLTHLAGSLHLGGAKAFARAEWPGKSEEDWDAERILIEFDAGADIRAQVERDVRAARRIRALGVRNA